MPLTLAGDWLYLASSTDNPRLVADSFWFNAVLLFRRGKLDIFRFTPLEFGFPVLLRSFAPGKLIFANNPSTLSSS
jgi:hypothetical protein